MKLTRAGGLVGAILASGASARAEARDVQLRFDPAAWIVGATGTVRVEELRAGGSVTVLGWRLGASAQSGGPLRLDMHTTEGDPGAPWLLGALAIPRDGATPPAGEADRVGAWLWQQWVGRWVDTAWKAGVVRVEEPSIATPELGWAVTPTHVGLAVGKPHACAAPPRATCVELHATLHPSPDRVLAQLRSTWEAWKDVLDPGRPPTAASMSTVWTVEAERDTLRPREITLAYTRVVTLTGGDTASLTTFARWAWEWAGRAAAARVTPPAPARGGTGG